MAGGDTLRVRVSRTCAAQASPGRRHDGPRHHQFSARNMGGMAGSVAFLVSARIGSDHSAGVGWRWERHIAIFNRLPMLVRLNAARPWGEHPISQRNPSKLSWAHDNKN